MKTREIAEFLSAELVGDGNVEIRSVAAADVAADGQIAFLESPGLDVISQAGCLIVPVDLSSAVETPLIKVSNPKAAFSRVAALLHPRPVKTGGSHESVVVAARAVIDASAWCGPFVVIGENSSIGADTHIHSGAKIGSSVTIGRRCVIHPNVVIEDDCALGDNVILHAGVIIGADGFGYVRDGDKHLKFPQIGTVIIEDDVEIGANTCIDRGALGETRIGEGTKIDNLVQIGHNVQIGKRVIIAAQTGISGSTVIEDDCIIGGQVGMGDHARILSGAVIGSQAGVLPGKIVRPGVWWGTPIQRLEDYKRQNAHVKGLERLKADVKRLKERLQDTE